MPIRVLLTDDDPIARDCLAQMIGNSPDMQIVGLASNGLQAVHMAMGIHPDVVVLDAHIVHMNVIETIREIMDANPVPIVVVCSTTCHNEADLALDAIKAGAVAVLQKPDVNNKTECKAVIKELMNSIRAMSGVRVIRHPKAGHTHTRDISKLLATAGSDSNTKPEIISIVASTGGPQALSEIIKHLPITFNLPIVIVQHITADFVPPLVNWLSTISHLPVQIACSGQCPEAGNIYFAPAKKHLRLGSTHHFELSDTPMNVPHIPSGDVFLESVAQHYASRAVGIILTGMGNDGARGLRAMYNAGAITVAQNAESCVVFGMPHEAITLGAVRQTLNPTEISQLLLQYAY